MKLEFALESVAKLWDEMEPLIQHGFQAFDPYPEIPLEVNRGAYEQVEALGVFRLYTARRAGTLVGYVSFIIGPSLRRRQICANQDVLHTTTDGAAWIAKGLIEYSEAELRAEGVQVVYHSLPMGSRFARLLEVEGYPPIMQVNAKILK